VCLSDDVGATTAAFFPASFTGTTALAPAAVDSPTWVAAGPGTPAYLPAADLLAAAPVPPPPPPPPVIVDTAPSQHPQQVPASVYWSARD